MTDESVRPFEITVNDGVLSDLKHRLANTRWPESETVDDWSQGIPLAYAQDLCHYWANEYDWRTREALLNQYPQFISEFDGLAIHFYHARSPHPDAMPILITHGWPGSVVEFQKVIGRLIDPPAYGGEAADAFHVVCPSLPGFSFSGKPTGTGWGIGKIAETWNTLMLRLGYDGYVAQGGDWGSAVTSTIGVQNLGQCRGIHINMVSVAPDPATMDDLTDLEKRALAGMKHYRDIDSGYSKQQSTRPQTLGYALTDSPSGQLAWIVEKFWSWMDCDGHPENTVSRDELLDNVMLYWCTASAASSARLYWESFNKFSAGEVHIPTGCSIFPKEIFLCSPRWAEQRYKNIIHWNELDKGGHFAAFEQPELFVKEITDCFRSLR